MLSGCVCWYTWSEKGDGGIQETCSCTDDLFVSETVIIISSVCVLLIKLSPLKVLSVLPSVLRSTCAAAQVAGLQHLIFMPCQLKANVPTCRLLYVATLQTLTGLSYCFVTKLRAICIWEVKQAVPLWTIRMACEQASAVCDSEDSKRNRADQRAA